MCDYYKNWKSNRGKIRVGSQYNQSVPEPPSRSAILFLPIECQDLDAFFKLKKTLNRRMKIGVKPSQFICKLPSYKVRCLIKSAGKFSHPSSFRLSFVISPPLDVTFPSPCWWFTFHDLILDVIVGLERCP